jgi:hypothetical protein
MNYTKGGVTHPEYNKAVKEELDKFVKVNKICPTNKMTQAQAEEFLGSIKNSANPTISKFNSAVEADVIKSDASAAALGIIGGAVGVILTSPSTADAAVVDPVEMTPDDKLVRVNVTRVEQDVTNNFGTVLHYTVGFLFCNNGDREYYPEGTKIMTAGEARKLLHSGGVMVTHSYASSVMDRTLSYEFDDYHVLSPQEISALPPAGK